MIRWVTSAISTVRTTTETIENHRLAVKSIDLVGSTMWMASLVSSVKTASSGLIIILTEKALATAAKPIARPASGFLLMVRKAAPANGMRTRYPASEAMLDRMPISAKM